MSKVYEIIEEYPTLRSAMKMFESNLKNLKELEYLEFFIGLKQKNAIFFNKKNLDLIYAKRVSAQAQLMGHDNIFIVELKNRIDNECCKEKLNENIDYLLLILHNEIIDLVICFYSILVECSKSEYTELEDDLIDLLNYVHELLLKKMLMQKDVDGLRRALPNIKSLLELRGLKLKEKKSRVAGALKKHKNYLAVNEGVFKNIEELWDTGKWKSAPKCAEDIHDLEGIEMSYRKVYDYLRRYKKKKNTSC